MSAHQILLILIGPGQMLPHIFFSDLPLNIVIFLLGLILHCIIVIYTQARLLTILHEELNCMGLSSGEETSRKFLPLWRPWWKRVARQLTL